MTNYEILGVPRDADKETVYKAFLDKVKKYHPDRNIGDKVAHEKFLSAKKAFDEIMGSTPGSTSFIGNWEIEGPCAKGHICDVYYAQKVEKTDGKPDLSLVKAIVKLSRDSRDEDLMLAEWKALNQIKVHKPVYSKIAPEPLERFKVSGKSAHALSLAVDKFSLEDIKTFYPKGLDFRHIVWMGNRGLSALGFIHRNKIAHGAVLPPHLMFGPKSHELMLVDWCYSVELATGESIKAVPKDLGSMIPPEVAKKHPPRPATDIYMLMASLKSAAESIPQIFKGIFEWCLASSPSARPVDAWELQNRWKALAEKQYGPPTYVELNIPVV